MRRKYFGLAIAAIATFGPMQAWGGDREIAEQIIQRLKVNRDSGALKDFTLDMKVDKGVVLFRGNVSEAAQKDLVLGAANGIEGIAKVVDEVNVATAAAVVKPKPAIAPAAPTAPVATAQTVKAAKPIRPVAKIEAAEPAKIAKSEVQDFSFRQALAQQTESAAGTLAVVPGEIRPAAAVEARSDADLVAEVVSALGRAKQSGQLKGFGVDVKSTNGVLQITGRAASSEQRDQIVRIAQSVGGVSGVREAITIPTAAPSLPRLPEPPALQEVEQAPLTPIAAAPNYRGTPAMNASAPMGTPAMQAPYRTAGMQTAAMPASMGMPVQGQPVPMAPYAAAGAPRYDSPNLPNYAWPGYAAYPNYAALTYPQQYSPSAWPYIGPFYPYPQVPLGWRKVSLEWDDGWWFLDFTDK